MNHNPVVFFYEAFEEEESFIRQFLTPRISAGFTWKTIQEYNAPTPPAPVISIRTQSVIPPEWASNMEGLLTRSTGYDHVKKYLAQTGAKMACGYLPLYCARAVAEQAMLMWMALLRKLSQQTGQFKTFHRDGITGFECEGKHLLVVGVGHIGEQVIRIGKGLGMKTAGVDISHKHQDVTYLSLDEGMAHADIVVCAMNLTADNRNYFHRETLLKMKKGSLFINIARGELSPLRDLLQALDEGHLGGIGLDVYNNESELAVSLRSGQPSSDPEVTAALELMNRPQVILTPHNAFNTVESVERKARQSVEQMEHYLVHHQFKWLVP
ncbi:MAG: NAD(P)-dependent oxidoreductase [Lentisphaerota bacterium]